jgi:hypothetical protein
MKDKGRKGKGEKNKKLMVMMKNERWGKREEDCGLQTLGIMG